MYTFIFRLKKLQNNLASVEKELQQVKKDNATLARYINARRKEARRKKEAQKKAEEEARRKAMVVAPTSDEG
jgi:ribosome-interacting GTPase 1